MPNDKYLCKKMGKLNLTLVEGYPSRSSEAGGLLKDQCVWPARSQAKWYGFESDQQKSETRTGKTVSSWNTDASKVNSTYSHIARAAGIASTHLPHVRFHRTILDAGKSLHMKAPPYVTRQLASIDAYIECRKICSPS